MFHACKSSQCFCVTAIGYIIDVPKSLYTLHCLVIHDIQMYFEHLVSDETPKMAPLFSRRGCDALFERRRQRALRVAGTTFIGSMGFCRIRVKPMKKISPKTGKKICSYRLIECHIVLCMLTIAPFCALPNSGPNCTCTVEYLLSLEDLLGSTSDIITR